MNEMDEFLQALDAEERAIAGHTYSRLEQHPEQALDYVKDNPGMTPADYADTLVRAMVKVWRGMRRRSPEITLDEFHQLTRK